ncbi:MAG: IPT/TIG domain-containing protein [Candidatus Acidiferrales bacterium]
MHANKRNGVFLVAFSVLFFGVVQARAQGSLPTGWQDQDIGTVSVAGSASYANGVFTVNGSGQSLLNGASDAFNFAYQQMSGDGSIVARVVSTSGSFIQTGVMIRGALTSGATSMVPLDANGTFYDAYRTTTGGSIAYSQDTSYALPYWLEVVRSGNTFAAFVSIDGVNWVQEGSTETINMAQTVYVGLVVDSWGAAQADTATFDNVSISTTANPAPAITSVSATTASAGSQIVISGSGFGASQGNSAVVLNDSPVTISSWSATSITITIPSGATSGYLAVSVAPSMNDSNPVDFTVTASPLPTGWLDQDVGNVGVAGNASYASGVFTITAAGSNMLNGTTDDFHFTYQQLSGNGTIVARIASISNRFVQAGVMIRGALDSDSQNIDVLLNDSALNEVSRATTGGSNAPVQGPGLPYWVMLVRSGNTFVAYGAPDGASWTLVGGPIAIDMPQTVNIGLFATGESTTTTYSATFDNVSISTTANPAPVITSISQTTGSVGTEVVISGSGFGGSQGNSEVFLNDTLVTVNSWSATSITITIPTGATSGYIGVSVAPSMTSSNGVYFAVSSQPLAGGWLDQDIGAVGATGSATYTDGVFTVQAAGGGVTGQADGFHFVYQALSTDGSIQARVVSLPSNAEAGVMIRETLNASAAEAFSYFICSGQNLYEYMSDRTLDGSVVSSTVGSTVTAPYWVQVVRNANQFSMYVSTNGATWFQIGTTQTIATTQTVYVGLAVSSRTAGTLATATLDNVSIGSGSSVANPTISGLSPTTGAPGQSVTISGSGFGATQSGGTVSFNTASATVTSWSDSQIVAVVPDEATTGPVSVTAGSITVQGPTFTVAFPVQVTDSLGNQTAYTSAPAGGEWVLTSSQGSGCSTCTTRGNIQNQYDGNGNLIGTTDPNGNTVLYANDSSGDVTEQVAALNSTPVTTTYTYNSFGEVLTMTDPLGNVTTNTYDSHGDLLTVTTPKPNSSTSASETQFAYNSLGELTQITDPLNRITKITYTTAGYIASITDPQSNVTSYGYDARGNRTSVTDAMSNQTTFTYDMGNRLTGITYPDSSTVSFTYDYRGRRITATDQNGKTTTYAYDEADRLTSVTDPAGNATQYAYDTENNLLSITDANGHTTNFAYDAFGRVTKTTFPSNNSENYAYDADNNLTSKTDRNGNTIQYVYDALNRLTQKTYPDSTTAEYTYDLVGKILQANDPTGTYAFAYDNMGRLIGTTTTYSFLNTPFTNSYSYDADSNRTGYTAPDGSTNTYSYDTLNRLTTLANSWAGSFGFSYDALSRLTQMTRPNGIATNYQYNTLSRLLSVLHQAGSSTIDGASYTLDAAGNRTAKTDDLAGVTSDYTYDKIYELTQVVQGSNTTESYSYDPVGNRTASLAIPSYTVNSSNELTSDSNALFAQDYNGNTTLKTDSTGSTTYAWDYENRLSSVTLPNSGGTVQFKYDPFGRRIEKISSNATSIFVYDGNNLVETVNSSGGVVARYAQGQTIDEPLAMQRGSTVDYYEQDGLGSVTSLTAANGSVAQTYTYDSFGNTTNSTGSLTNFFRYTGREFDTETGLYFLRGRYFDPQTGRFLSEDPMEFAAGDVNLYRYVYNNSVNSVDPTGFFPTGKDKWWGHNDPNFHWWWHNCYWKGEPYDGTKEDVEIAWGLWNGLGRPPKGKCGDNKPCPEPEPAPEPEPEPSPDSGPNWKAVGVGVGVVIVGVGVVVLCPECLVLAPAFAF